MTEMEALASTNLRGNSRDRNASTIARLSVTEKKEKWEFIKEICGTESRFFSKLKGLYQRGDNGINSLARRHQIGRREVITGNVIGGLN